MSLLQDDKEKLIGNQKKLDANNDGSIDAGDFKLLRKDKAEGGPMGEEPMMDTPMMNEPCLLYTSPSPRDRG